jgi:gliding motility-associated-like protein
VAVAAIDSTSGCYPKSVTFFNGSIGADSYQWVYGTGTVSNTADLYHTITYYNFGTTQATYNVTLNAITNNGCQSQANLTINVSPPINAEFAFQQQGCSPLVVYFDNQSDGGYSYHWNFGDGDVSTQIEPEHNFFNYGTTDTTYHVTLIIQNQFGCSDTTDANVVVYARPNAGFTATPDLQTWPDATVQIGNNSIGSSLNFEWNMGNGTTLYVANPNSYTYQTWGEYTIRLIASNGTCSDTTFQSLTILPPAPVANFEGPAEGCAPLTVQFTSTSENVVMSMWQFGDGGQANATNPVYTYWQPGTYTVTLTVTGYDGTTETITQEQIIHVYPSAVAAFTVTPNEVNVPDQPVYCLNLSSNSSTYTWDFGDGSTSSEVNPLYYYTEEGVFDVTLIANNQYNCPDTMVVVDAVHAKAGGLIDFPNAFTPKPDGGNGGIYDAMGFENDVFFPMHAGVDEYVLQIFNKWGELLFESKDVNRGWDGYYRGQLCKQDVYVWKVKARLVDGQIYEKAGDVTLLIK